MRDREAEFQQRIRAAFLVEAREHLQSIASGLLALERKAPDLDTAALESVFRHTHSLKGAARAASFGRVEHLCQALETILALCRERKLMLDAGHYDLLHQAFDLAGELVASPEGSADIDARTAQIVQRLTAITPELASQPALGPMRAKPASSGTAMAPEVGIATPSVARDTHTRVSTLQLDALLRSAEEMLLLKHSGQERSRQFEEVEQEFAAWRKRWTSVQPSLRQLRRPAVKADSRPDARPESATRVLEFVHWSLGHIKALESRVEALARCSAQDRHAVARRVDDLLLQSKSLLMAPLSTLIDWMPKMVRDLARSQGKQAELVIEGDEVQVDRRLIDEMKDPLIHLLRNAVDHGVEIPSERASAGKPEKAMLRLEIRFASGDRIEFIVRDDGRGIDTHAVREAAVRMRLVDEDIATEMDDAEASELVFRSQLSTSPVVTDLSGRGLGLAIVKDQAEKLGGQVFARSEPGRGCTFRVVLPQRLGALRGLFVRVGDATLVIPGMHVICVTRIPHAEVKMVQGRETVLRAGRVIPLMALGDVLRPRNYRGLEEAALLTVVFIEVGSEALALAVDEVLDEEEILIKRLEPPLQRVRNIAGATVRPSGTVFPVLNVADLVRSVRRAKTGEPARTTVARRQTAARARLLLAEDSITSRLLLKGILEAAGYEVRTAADGVEAFTALRSGSFDLLVSDIEMPRLNGFDLTARIRADAVLKGLPVVLVTALASKEDREHGIDVGANAYIAKGSFDQRELIDAVRRLLALGERE